MAWPGQEIHNPEIGERVRFMQTAADTDGELLETEQWLAPGGSSGVLHVHPEQEERFTVIDGTLRVRIAGAEQDYGPGQSATVPPGTAHVFENASSAATHFRGEVRPALRTEEFFERLASLAQQNGATPAKHLSPMTLAPLIHEYRREVALPRLPVVVQHAAIRLLAAFARRQGGGELPPLATSPSESTPSHRPSSES